MTYASFVFTLVNREEMVCYCIECTNMSSSTSLSYIQTMLLLRFENAPVTVSRS